METQILKLREPYNVICSKGVFAYHIATLIVVDEIPNKEDPSIELSVEKMKMAGTKAFH